MAEWKPSFYSLFYCCVRFWYWYDFWSKWDIISYLISENCKGYYIISNIPILDIISDMIWKRYKKIDIFTTTGYSVQLRSDTTFNIMVLLLCRLPLVAHIYTRSLLLWLLSIGCYLIPFFISLAPFFSPSQIPIGSPSFFYFDMISWAFLWKFMAPLGWGMIIVLLLVPTQIPGGRKRCF